MIIHDTVPVQVWVEVDTGVADMVRDLNAIPGVRTFASCQGGNTYGPYVMTYWPEKVDALIRERYEVGETGDGWAQLHPRGEIEDE